MTQSWSYIPVSEAVRDKIKQKKGILTYSQYFTKMVNLN